jgi:hypothetical protein
VVHNQREHVLVRLGIMRDEEFHSIHQVTQRICHGVLFDGVQDLRQSNVVVGDSAGYGVIKVNPSLRVNV